MKNKFKIDGLWIPYQILTDKNLREIFGVTKKSNIKNCKSFTTKRIYCK